METSWKNIWKQWINLGTYIIWQNVFGETTLKIVFPQICFGNKEILALLADKHSMAEYV